MAPGGAFFSSRLRGEGLRRFRAQRRCGSSRHAVAAPTRPADAQRPSPLLADTRAELRARRSAGGELEACALAGQRSARWPAWSGVRLHGPEDARCRAPPACAGYRLRAASAPCLGMARFCSVADARVLVVDFRQQWEDNRYSILKGPKGAMRCAGFHEGPAGAGAGVRSRVRDTSDRRSAIPCHSTPQL